MRGVVALSHCLHINYPFPPVYLGSCLSLLKDSIHSITVLFTLMIWLLALGCVYVWIIINCLDYMTWITCLKMHIFLSVLAFHPQ